MRLDILQGNLPLPGKYKFEEYYTSNVVDKLERMWESLWHNYCANKSSTSSIYWMEEFKVDNSANFINIIKILVKSNWITTTASNNFATLQLNESRLLDFVSAEELEDVRFSKRFDKYLPICSHEVRKDDCKVRANGKTLVGKTLYRPGMQKGATSKFSYDRSMLSANLEAVTTDCNKGMDKVLHKYPELMSDKANYGNVVKEIIKHLATTNVMSDMGVNLCDTRGRAIKSNLSKVANPIGFKAFRALIIIPEKNRKVATSAGAKNVYLFIAELNGYKVGTVDGKVMFGQDCWLTNTLPYELHESMWCQRLYKELDGYTESVLDGTEFKWSVPLELDSRASLLQYIGILLNDADLLTATSVLSEGELNDPWGLTAGVDRGKAKMVLMRKLYGSSRDSASILKSFQEEYSEDDIHALETELNTGAYGKANLLKEFIIGNCNMTEVMNPVVWGEQLHVPCNRHHSVGDKPVVYTAVNEKGLNQKIVHWKTVKVADLKSFKRWTMTGLIHSLDSRVIDKVMQTISWGIDIHDAVICGPEDVNTVRSTCADSLDALHADRSSILNDYFKSVGIKATPKAQKEWNDIMSQVNQVDTFKCSMWAMK